MHEFAMGEEVVLAVLKEMDRLPAGVVLKRVRVILGAPHRVDPESLRLAYEAGTSNTAAAGSTLEITLLPAEVLCRDCHWQGEPPDPLLLCRECGSANLQTIQGAELSLAELEVEEEG